MEINFNALLNQGIAAVTEHGTNLLIALAVFVIGWKVIKMLCKGMAHWFEKADYDEALETFLLSLTGMGLKALLFVTAAGIAGIPTTSLVAIIGAAGLAIGMALSGTLQNFAGGVLLLVLKPFKIGDFIETQGHSGTVRQIQIFNTIINTGDNKRIILPNGPVATGALINYSAESKRRVDMLFGIGYDDDIDQAKDIIMNLIKADERIDTDPAPFIAVKELADSSVNLVVRVWADASNYWGIHFDLTENVKKAFDQKGISIPFPQSDVHIHKVDATQ
ncbi:mechanosensitive ion channel [Verrucomicrobiaceae bacterium N1E253]|uniref:Mechanosensitive ion channel n=1 Tax=Oceaniferula marina TaxID=2748318 RepID=A0A851GHH2_9BACT|nr:mechanosensitive ion channel domain-containing protein [Oceaniferula marina]NWK54050.1 mechanosensitive ion channel [Oceaniferula marina]